MAMGGLNSLSGLNNMSVDYRPTVELIKTKPDNSNQLTGYTDKNGELTDKF